MHKLRSSVTGRYKKRGRYTLPLLIILAASSFLAFHTNAMEWLESETQRLDYIADQGVSQERATSTPIIDDDLIDERAAQLFAAKIEALQNSVLEQLSLHCEAQGLKEPDGAIVFDSNEVASIGRFQFQVLTVQYYVQVFEEKEIDRAEAIRIAIDKEQATELARSIIFNDTVDNDKEVGGLWNWKNCTRKLNLVPQVEAIKSIMN